MIPLDLARVPEAWRALVAEINGARIPDGTAGIRDVDAPCAEFTPAGAPWEEADGTGACETDGHYICRECVHISQRALRRRQDRCEECGEKLVGFPLFCPACDVGDDGFTAEQVYFRQGGGWA